MSKRSYNQYCAVARSLDIVGERWTLLVVRELLTGPKRFKDLLEGLPGIGTNLLTARLKDLEGYAVVHRVTLPPPAGSKVYELTELGSSLEPVIAALGRWGLEFLDTPDQEDDLRPAWAVVAMRSALKQEAARGLQETYEFHIDEETFHLRVKDGEVEALQGPAVDPDLVVRGGTQAFLALVTGRVEPVQALDSGEIRVEGDQETWARCVEVLGLSLTPKEKTKNQDSEASKAPDWLN
ncbi:MAG: winged helix-turn-helix transcriptional regulator [Actinomycetota bacterium]|nr:winged helix-turn-helix transcriptional regulator [Actinomycetota bacterium]